MSILGIDPAANKLSMMLVDRDGSPLAAKTFNTSSAYWKTGRIGEANSYIASVVTDLKAHHGLTRVFLEEPIYWRGGKSTIPLAQISGAVIAAVENSGMKIEMVANSRWKLRVIGKGNAKKEEIMAWVIENHPEYMKYIGDDQDLCDAACIARYGADVMRFRSRIKPRLMEDE